MRSQVWVRWATCALAISICIPALAETRTTVRSKSISTCTSFDQEDKGEDKVQLTIKNSCSIPVDCSISWRVVCAPSSKKRRAVHPTSLKLSLTDGASESAEASAAVCGDDAFVLDSVRWSCQPNNE